MDSLRFWILGAAAGSFVAGLVVGRTITMTSVADTTAPAEVREAQELADRYGLTAEQQREVRLVLQNNREREIAILRSVHGNQLPQPQLGEMLFLRTVTEQRIRALLDAGQRARYDLDSRPPEKPADREKG